MSATAAASDLRVDSPSRGRRWKPALCATALLLIAVFVSGRWSSRLDERFVGTWSFRRIDGVDGLRYVVLRRDGAIFAYDDTDPVSQRGKSGSNGMWSIEGESFVIRYESGPPLDRLLKRIIDSMRKIAGRPTSPVDRYRIFSIRDDELRIQLSPNSDSVTEWILTRVRESEATQ